MPERRIGEQRNVPESKTEKRLRIALSEVEELKIGGADGVQPADGLSSDENTPEHILDLPEQAQQEIPETDDK
jgi:hypothetical protein